MLLERFHVRRRKGKGRHPTAAQAYDALSQGSCLYAPLSTCSGPPRQTGLRDRDDLTVVLACGAHAGRLRRIKPHDLTKLERNLAKAFGKTGPVLSHGPCPAKSGGSERGSSQRLTML